MSLHVIDNVREMAELASQWNYSADVVLVPTMGYLHDGHLSLIRKAAAQAKTVIVSIFVNPLQFGPNEDYNQYPRDFKRDVELLEAAGAHLVFMPQTSDITPPAMQFKIDPGSMGNVLCGKYRPGHFIGVCTIVSKLFNIVRPGVAIFGWKDAQQFLILNKMVSDLHVPVTLIAVDTMREQDGLAMSSRNSYLTKQQRAAAPKIFAALVQAADANRQGEVTSKSLLDRVRKRIADEPLLELQYVEAVAMDTLEPVDTVRRGNTLIAVAVYAGETRLIDNIRL